MIGSQHFVRLMNHRISAHRVRTEDFLTEALVSTLQSDPHLLATLLEPGGPLIPSGGPHLLQPAITTQCTIADGQLARPDITFRRGEVVLYVESKVDSPFDPQQILTYCRLAETMGPTAYVLSLVPERSVPADLPRHDRFLGCAVWEDLADTLAIHDGPLTTALSGLLLEVGLKRIRELVLWHDGTQQDVEGVKAIGAILSRAVQTVMADRVLEGLCPDLFTRDGWLLRDEGLQVSGRGEPPRPVLRHSVRLDSRLGHFQSAYITTSFERDSLDRRPLSVRFLFAHQDVVNGTWCRTKVDLATTALQAAGTGAELTPMRAEVLLERLVERQSVVLAQVAATLGLQVEVDVEPGFQALSIALCSTSELLGEGVDPVVLERRFADLVARTLHAFFEAGPTLPLALFIAEAVAPDVGRLGG